MTLLSHSSFLYSGRMETHSKAAWRKPSLFSAKEREALQQNEALTSSPVLGNCSTVYQSRRSAFFPTNSFDFLRSSWNSNRFSRCYSGKSQSPGRGIKTRNNQPSHAEGPLVADSFLQSPSRELNMEPWVGSGNSWKSVQDGWWKLSRGGGWSMQILKTGNWCWALLGFFRFCWEKLQPAVCKTDHWVMQSVCKQCGSSVTDEENRTANQDGEEIVRFQGILQLIL